MSKPITRAWLFKAAAGPLTAIAFAASPAMAADPFSTGDSHGPQAPHPYTADSYTGTYLKNSTVLIPVQDQEDHDDNNDNFGMSNDCSNEGREKVIVFDNGAGKTWHPMNTSRWCDAPGHTINPTEDPIFRSEG